MRHFTLTLILYTFLVPVVKCQVSGWEASLLEADSLLRAGETNKAFNRYSRCIEICPWDYRPYHGRATTYLSGKKYEEALQDLLKAIEINPGHADSYRLAAEAYDKLKQDGEAESMRKSRELIEKGVDPTTVRMMHNKLYTKLIVFIEKSAENKLEKWLNKGEFETTEAYQERVADVDREEKMQEFRNISLNEFIRLKPEYRQLSYLSYNADKQLVTLGHQVFGQFILEVPPDEAKKFKKALPDTRIDSFRCERDTAADLIGIVSFALHCPSPANRSVINDTEYEYYADSRSFKRKALLLSFPEGPGTGPGDGGVPDPPEPADDSKRLALVIGNGDYLHGGKLANPRNDAEAIEDALRQVGFDVLKYVDLDLEHMHQAIDAFGYSLKNYSVGLVFYAGHGIQAKGDNFLIPIDAKLESESEVPYKCVNTGLLLAKMEDARNPTNIIILDACRDNPFEQSWSRAARGSGLAFMDAPSGSIIAYATSPGKTASDGQGVNGLYTSAILKHIRTPGQNILEMFQEVRKSVKKGSNGKQTPWESTSLEDNFYFIPPVE